MEEFGEDPWSVAGYCLQHQMQDLRTDYLLAWEASRVGEEVEEMH